MYAKVVVVAFFLVALVAQQAGFANPASPTKPEIDKLAERLRAGPSKAEVLAAAEALGRRETPDPELLEAFRSVLTNSTTRAAALLALSSNSVRALEPDLLDQLDAAWPKPTTDLLSAVAASGKDDSFAYLLDRVVITAGPGASDAATQTKVWDALIAIDEARAGRILFERYTAPSPSAHQIGPDAQRQLAKLADDMGANSQLMAVLVGSAMRFLRNAKDVGPFPVPPNSARSVILGKLLTSLQANPTPLTQTALLLFLDVDNNEFSSSVARTSFNLIIGAPWLVPDVEWVRWLFPHTPLTPEQRDFYVKAHLPVPDDRTICPKAAEKFKALSLQRPGDFGFGFEYIDVLSGRGWSSATSSSGRGWSSATFSSDASRRQIELGASIAAEARGLLKAPEDLKSIRADLSQTASSLALLGFPFDYRTLATANLQADWTAWSKHARKATDIGAYGTNIDYDAPHLFVDGLVARRALVLYALLSHWRATKTAPQRLDLVALDSTLDKELAKLDERYIVTRVHRGLEPLAPPQGQKQSPHCPSLRARVLRRSINLDTHLYTERLLLTCPDGTEQRVDWHGEVPLGLVPALQRHPRLLDILNTSLAVREFSLPMRSPLDPDDLSALFGLEGRATLILGEAALHPSIPWTLVQQVLRAMAVEEIDLDLVGFSSPPIIPLDKAVSNPGLWNIAPSVANYATGVASATATINEYLVAREGQRMVNALDPLINGLPNTVTRRVPALCPDGHSICGFSEGDIKNSLKVRLVDQRNQIVKDYNAKQEMWSKRYTDPNALRFSRDRCANARSHQDPVFIRFNPEFTKFLAEYRFTTGKATCDITLEIPVGLPTEAIKRLRFEIMRDPLFLSRYRLDPAMATAEAGQRLSYVLARSGLQARTQLVRTLRSADLLTVSRVMGRRMREAWSSSRTPLLGAERFAEFPEGWTYLRKVGLFYDLVRLHTPLQRDPVVNEAVDGTFLQKVMTRYQEVEAAADKQTDDRVASIRSDLSKTPSNWSVFAGIGGPIGAPIPFISWSTTVGDFSVSLTLNTGGVLDLRGTWATLPIPLQHSFLLWPSTSAPDLPAVPSPDRSEDLQVPAGGGNSLFGDVNLAMGLGVQNWLAVPAPSDWAAKGASQIWEAGLIYRASANMVPEEKVALARSLTAKSISPALQAILEARAAMDPHDGKRLPSLPTSFVVDQLIPDKSSRSCTGTCVDLSDERAVTQYIDAFNAAAKRRFDAETNQLKLHGRMLIDGVPSVAVVLGNNGRVILLRFDYLLDSGDELTTYALLKAPSELRSALAAHPEKHILERAYLASVRTLKSWPASAPPRALFATFAADVLAGDEVTIAQQTPPSAFVLSVGESFTQYWDSLQQWANQQLQSGAVQTPFVPPMLAAPMAGFLSPPLGAINASVWGDFQILRSETSSAVGQAVTSGTSVVDSGGFGNIPSTGPASGANLPAPQCARLRANEGAMSKEYRAQLGKLQAKKDGLALVHAAKQQLLDDTWWARSSAGAIATAIYGLCKSTAEAIGMLDETGGFVASLTGLALSLTDVLVANKLSAPGNPQKNLNDVADDVAISRVIDEAGPIAQALKLMWGKYEGMKAVGEAAAHTDELRADVQDKVRSLDRTIQAYTDSINGTQQQLADTEEMESQLRDYIAGHCAPRLP